MNSSPDARLVNGLTALCASNGAAHRLFESFAARKNDATETTVDRAAYLAGADYTSMVKVFKDLATLGVGRFIPGRHSYPSRMEWSFSIRSLGKVATGSGSALQDVAPGATADIPEADPNRLKHEFRLRDGFKVILELPADITEKEADRLALWVKSLPF